MKSQNPWMGRVRGSAGNMTGCKVYDKNVLRAKAFEVSNPDTAAQQTQRDFFKEVAGIVATVSVEELRSLFGIMPKAMSRRNALSKQVAAAFSVDGNEKHVDFSKLQAIGNGSKVTTPIIQVSNGEAVFDEVITLQMLGTNANENTNLIGVFFNETDQSIMLINTNYTVQDEPGTGDVLEDVIWGKTGYGYVTCATDGKNVFESPFGSFNLKTRSAGKKVEPTPPALEVTIYSGGTESGNFFHFDGSLFDHSNHDEPDSLVQGRTYICSLIQWDEVNNWWFGTTGEDIDLSLPLTLNGTINGESVTDIPVDWVVQ